MNIKELLGKRIVFFDGGMGTMLQEKGMQPGENTDIWNFTRPDDIIDVHRQYMEAGADIIIANTFGANRLKLSNTGYTVDQIIGKAIENAKKACGDKCYIALDLAPTGKLLKPLGDLSFDEAVDIYKEMAIAGERAGADLIHIETMSDTYELKAAVLAAKENTNLPVFATVTFDSKGKMLTGGNPAAVVALLEGLGVDAMGVNCGLGPDAMSEMVEEFLSLASIPVIVNPNAGLPEQIQGKTVYNVGPEEFVDKMEEFVKSGVWIVGGCCGTTPAHIKLLVDRLKDIKPKPIEAKNHVMVSSYTHSVIIGDAPIIIGERINPTGKSRLKQALREKDMDYILQEGFGQQEKGAHILDINVGLPEINEVEMILQVMKEVQSVIDLPLQIDTANIEAMEKALRYYNGKAMINSVNGKKESMEAIFPLVKKYGGVVIGLTLDESGIPMTAEGRFEIAKKIVETAKSYGIDKKDIIIDVLTMTISSDYTSAKVTLDALKMVKERLGVKTSLGVSNISFGLPRRDLINSVFYSMAMEAGLDCGIINTNAEGMMASYYSYLALAGKDPNCESFIEQYKDTTAQASITAEKKPTNKEDNMGLTPLEEAIVKGLKEQSRAIAEELINKKEALAIINEELVPALDRVGKGFEKGTIFLPQLLMSADAAKSAFEVLREKLNAQGGGEKKGKVIVATVKGDIHDIGKNIVKVLLENYGYDVYDLGKDVSPEEIVETAIKEDIKLVGLSALMTTTVSSMEETIRLLKERKPDCKVMVGGAVLTDKYAEMIEADYYVKDAMASVYCANEAI